MQSVYCKNYIIIANSRNLYKGLTGYFWQKKIAIIIDLDKDKRAVIKTN